MGGEGSMMHAIQSLRNNKAQRSKRNLRNWKDYINTEDVPTEDHIKSTPEQLAEIRQKLQEENKAILRKKVILTASIIGSILAVLTVLNQFL